MALITPPVGLNLYVVQGARKSGNMSEVMLGSVPYVFAMLAMATALIASSQIALFHPSALQRHGILFRLKCADWIREHLK